MITKYERRIRIPVPASVAFAWHERPETLRKLIPAGEPVRLGSRSGDGIHDGARVVLLCGKSPFLMKWVALHDGYVAGRQFRDTQVSGPFKNWVHTHSFMPDGLHACVMTDCVEYEIPFGAAGQALLENIVRRKLDSMFDWRHHVTYSEIVLELYRASGLGGAEHGANGGANGAANVERGRVIGIRDL